MVSLELHLGSVRNSDKPNRRADNAEFLLSPLPSTERNSVMVKRYKTSDEAWGVVFDLFIETHGQGQQRLSPPNAQWRALVTLLGCCVARYAGALWPVVNGLSTVSALTKPGEIRSDAQTLAPETE